MLCKFTGAVHLFNNNVPSVINKVASRRKKQNNYVFNIQVLIITHKSIWIRGDLFLLWIGDLGVVSFHFPMNEKPGHLTLARQVFLSFSFLKTDV